MSKEYRKRLGFTNRSKTSVFLTAKDIVTINWSLIESYNARLIDIFTRIQSTLFFPPQDIKSIIESAYHTIKSHDILYKLSNHGRSPESVYYAWLQGYTAAKIFQPLIESELNCKLIQNGADDLSNPSTFSRKSDPDLTNENHTVFVEIQAGFKGGKIDIKKTKLKVSDTAEYYIACFDCFNGRYCIMNTRSLMNLPESKWYVNTLWEGALCYTVPENEFKIW